MALGQEGSVRRAGRHGAAGGSLRLSETVLHLGREWMGFHYLVIHRKLNSLSKGAGHMSNSPSSAGTRLELL